MLLLLCILVTIAPFNILHQHNEKETHCDLTNVKAENDPCLISIYHAKELQKHHCDHKTHIDEINIECEFCKFITSHRHTYTKNKYQSIVPVFNSKELIACENTLSLSSFSSVIFSRGPPA